MGPWARTRKRTVTVPGIHVVIILEENGVPLLRIAAEQTEQVSKAMARIMNELSVSR